MSAENNKTAVIPAAPHRITIEDRHLMTVSGVVEVDNFDESKIEARTEQGMLIVEGENLHIVRLVTETGELVVEGLIGGLAYVDRPAQSSGGGFFARLIR